nr:immunoglobulin heavy chain junction region [Mus musculus]
CVRSDYAFAYW